MRRHPRPPAPGLAVVVACVAWVVLALGANAAQAGPQSSQAPWRALEPALSPAAATPLSSNADPPVNDTCAGAILIGCGTFDLSGDTSMANNDYTFTAIDTNSCVPYPMPGRDVVYKFTAVPGDSIRMDLETPGWDGALYIVRDCAAPDTTCLDGEDDAGISGTEFLREKVVVAGTYYIVIDTFQSGGGGPWSIHGQLLCVNQPPPPSNDRCDFPRTIRCGLVSFSGTTEFGTNDYQFPTTSNCVNSLAAGKDIAYIMNVVAGDSLALNYTSTGNGLAYIVYDCSNLEGTCIRGFNAVGVGGTELIRHQFVFSGTYYLILDSEGAGSFGTYSLTGNYICPLPPKNDICERAIPLPCGPFSENGSTITATDDYDLVDTLSCTGFGSNGRDVVYKVYATAGDSIWIDYTPLGSDASIYLATNCNDVTYSCVKGVDGVGLNETEELRYRFTSTNTYYIFLDNFGNNAGGNYEITGSLICPSLDVGDGPAGRLALGAIRPNPFRNSTAISFTLPAAGTVRLVLVDLQGRVVRTLVDRVLEPGSHQAQWDARDEQGHPVRAGVYFAKLSGRDGEAVRRAILVR